MQFMLLWFYLFVGHHHLTFLLSHILIICISNNMIWSLVQFANITSHIHPLIQQWQTMYVLYISMKSLTLNCYIFMYMMSIFYDDMDLSILKSSSWYIYNTLFLYGFFYRRFDHSLNLVTEIILQRNFNIIIVLYSTI